MKNRVLALTAALAAATTMTLATANLARAASLNVNLHVGDAPPPPAYVFEAEPEVILVPSTRVYYVPEREFDLYRYGRYWYINRGGWWYRASTYRGRFAYIEYDRVPVSILRVPARYHRHPLGGPPGQMKKMRGGDWDRDGHKGKHGRGR
jgi:hypothetical protein